MPNKQLGMEKIRQVLRCYSQGHGTKSISSMLSVSRNTVKKYLQVFQRSGLDYEQMLSLPDQELSKLFHEKSRVKTESERLGELKSLLPEYCKRLKKKGVTREALHREYLSSHPDGYGRTRFYILIQQYIACSRPIMHLEHKAGDKMFIDFAGDKLSIIDLDTGEIIPVEVFVAILPCSQLTYVEAVMSQKKEDLIRASENALLYYQGVPSAIIPDNLKSAVTKSSKYEALLNEDFAAFAEHYGCTVIPARAYKPRDKALVEGAVKLIYRSIYPKIQEREFYDLDSLNAAIRVALELHNNTPLTGRKYSRREQFEEIERDSLRKLNPIRFELRHRYRATVMKNGHVRLGEDAHYYSVPCRYIGKKVILSYTSRQVCIYYGYELIATHTRNRARCRYTTLEEHLASHHRYITEWNPDKFIHEAAAIHPDVEAYIRRVMEEKKHPEQAYKSCQGILSFARRVGNTRLTNACRWATSYGLYNYPIIERILNNRRMSSRWKTVPGKKRRCLPMRISEEKNIINKPTRCNMEMNQDTLEKMLGMNLKGMYYAFKTSLETHRTESMTTDQFVSWLVSSEWDDRRNRAVERAIRQASFRYKATIEEIDFSVERGLDKNLTLRLADLTFVRERKDLFITGSAGTGKSYLATAFGFQACQKGYKVLYANTSRLMGMLKVAKAKGTILQELKKIERLDMLILDDFGIQPFDSQGRMNLMDIIEDRHGKKSTIITSQVPVKDWYDVIGEKTIADAVLDRIVHQAIRIELFGESLRKCKSKK